MLGITNAINITRKLSIDSSILLLVTDTLEDKTGNYNLRNSLVTISPTNKRNGRNSLYFNGKACLFAGINQGQIPAAVAGTGKWTFEYWFYSEAAVGSACITHIKNQAAGAASWGILLGHSGSRSYGDLYISTNNSSWNFLQNQQLWPSVATGVWHHYAIVRGDSGIVKAFVDGAVTWTGSSNTTSFFKPTDGLIVIGGFANDNNYSVASSNYKINGFLQDIRFSNYARYTAAFTPPTSLL